MVMVRANTPVETITTYGPYVSHAAVNSSTHLQPMTKVVGPFAGEYIHFVVIGGPGDTILYMDDFQITNVFSASACTSFGKV